MQEGGQSLTHIVFRYPVCWSCDGKACRLEARYCEQIFSNYSFVKRMEFGIVQRLLANAEGGKNASQEIFRGELTGYLAQRLMSQAQLFRHNFTTAVDKRRLALAQVTVGLLECRQVAAPRHEGPFATLLVTHQLFEVVTQQIDAVAAFGRKTDFIAMHTA